MIWPCRSNGEKRSDRQRIPAVPDRCRIDHFSEELIGARFVIEQSQCDVILWLRHILFDVTFRPPKGPTYHFEGSRTHDGRHRQYT